MDIKNRMNMLKDLQASIFLPCFNDDLFSSCTKYQQEIFFQVSNAFKQQKNTPEQSEDIKSFIALKLKDMERTKRVQIAYLMYRLEKIQQQYWQDSGKISEQHISYLSEREKDYLKNYDELIRNYEKDLDAKIAQDVTPPSEVFIEVRVKKDIGEIVTQDGEILQLTTGTQLLVRKSDVIKFIRDGSIVQL